ncbi:thiol-disulfide oxidoreductase DCC family protein [Planctomycetota bacterium]
MEPQRIILFDGVCNLCSRSVRFIIRRDPAGVFRFASLQSTFAQECLARHGLRAETLDTLVVIDGDVIYTRSDAALQIASQLRSVWRTMVIFRILPRRLRDAIYRFVAKHRYRWFGKSENCMIPAPELMDRFIDREC